MKVLLVGNYEFDGSTSMRIWANTLLRELSQRGIDAKLITPKPILGKMKRSSSGVGKWLGYCDRFLFFPGALQAAACHADVVHICDNGGAIYVSRVKDKPVLVTCHDMLAVRGALGEIPDLKASFFGRFLQRWICRGLQNASVVACVSQFTFDDLRRILNGRGNPHLVLNGLNYPYRQISPEEADARLAALSEIDRPFILHIGSSHGRKNRDGVLRVFAQASRHANLKLVLAGRPLSREHLRLADELQIRDRIIQLSNPHVSIVEALYNRAVALLFPSRFEGFGWPPVEAQACGCPVVASDIPPLKEVIGQSGLLHSLDDEEGMAISIQRLATDPSLRNELQRRGLENVNSRFGTNRMMEQYVSLYREVASRNEH